MRRLFCLICLLFVVSAVRAQEIDRDLLLRTNDIVTKLGPMPDSSLKGIVGAISGHCNNEACVMYAIYMWAAHFIERDCASERHAGKLNNTASAVLRRREATTLGFANLIAEMCRLAHIDCEVVTGVAKWEVEDIGHVDNESNTAAWNLVTVGKRRYVLDAAPGAGQCDGKHFEKQLSDAWCLANRKLFALSHLPRDKRAQLLDTPVERPEFVAAPIIGPMAYIVPLIPQPGVRGLLRGRQHDTLQLSFSIWPAENEVRIGNAAVAVDGEVRPALFRKGNGVFTVGVPLPKEGKYPLTLLVNGAPAFIFQVQAAEALKRKR